MWKTIKGTVLGRKCGGAIDLDDVPGGSGLIAPTDSDSIPFRCEVVASGVEGVSVGDTVLYTGSGRTYSAIKFLPSLREAEMVNVHELCIVAVLAKEASDV